MRLARIYDWLGYVHAGGKFASAACHRMRQRAAEMKAERERRRQWVEERRARRQGGEPR